MTRRSKLWRVAAVVFAVVNVGGAGYAAANGEMLHAAVHVGLLLLLWAYLVLRGAPRARRQEELPGAEQAVRRLDQLQQSVDAIAIEVERIGEAQRFAAKLVAERAKAAPLKPQPPGSGEE